MRRVMLSISLAACGLFALLAVMAWNQPTDQPFARELARLEKVRDHAEPGSAVRFKAEHKIDRIRRHLDGEPPCEAPEQFARILTEMRIPADRTEPEYDAGYLVRELAQARAAKNGPTRDLAWHQRGPGNVAGRARSIVVDPDDPTNSTWFIASVGGGVWKTTDAGQTWLPLTDDFPVLSCQSLAMAASDHDVMYVGTGESFYNIDTINGNGILKSTDRGQTWTHLASTVDDPAFNNVARIVIDPTNPDIVLAATTVGRYKQELLPRSYIFKSTDGGATWYATFISTELGDYDRVKKVQQIVADPTNFNRLYATVDEAGILRSTDAGETWTYINSGITDFRGRFELAVSPVEPNRLYASAEGASHSELWISYNYGEQWYETYEQGDEPNWLGAQGWYDNTIVCHPTDIDVVYVGGIRLWRIDLTGSDRVTTQLAVGPVHVDHHGLVILDDGGGDWRILNTNDGGVGVSGYQDTGWDAPIDGMLTTQFYGIDKRPGASAYFGGMQDNSTWFSDLDPNANSPWNYAIGGDGYETSWHFDDPERMICGYQFNGLFRSLDGGLSWTPATDGLGDTGGGNAPFITKIAKSNLAPDLLFAVGVSGVWRSSDFGGSWSASNVPEATWGGNSSFKDVKISRCDPNVVWAGSRMDDDGQIHFSGDGGLNFVARPNYTTVTMGGISGLATHPTDPGTAYVLFSFAGRPKILATTDYGATWTDLTGFTGGSPSTNGFPDVAVYDLQVFSDDPDHMWAGTEIGLVETLDGGQTWALADNGLPAVSVWAMTEVEDEVVIGTHGRGIWTVTMPHLVEGQLYRPLIDDTYQSLDGPLNIDLNLRAEYDSTQVFVDDVLVATLPANEYQEDAVVQVPVVEAGAVTVFARGFQDEQFIDSLPKTAQVIVLQTPVATYTADFESGNDFVGDFSVTSWSGFSGRAIHSPHDYPDNANLTYMLTVPIRVAQPLGNDFIQFDEVVIVEPGEYGSEYGDSDFWDYVVVEGSRDGVTWLPLMDGYDCREDSAWQSAWNSGADGNSSMFRTRTIDLHDTFEWNETVLLRFRLYADGYVNGWGWAIDNLVIQEGAVGVDDVPAAALNLAQNVPNPFNPSTAIDFSLPHRTDVRLRVFDVRGRLVRTLVDGVRPAGPQTVEWDGRDGSGAMAASGVYLYRLEAGGESLQRRMTLIK